MKMEKTSFLFEKQNIKLSETENILDNLLKDMLTGLWGKGNLVIKYKHMKKLVTVNDKMQKGYKYSLTEKVGENFDRNFRPDLSPEEMLELGVFGGKYMTDCKKEFPKDWFVNAKFAQPDIFGKKKYEKNLNYFGVKASQDLSVWQEKGWLHKDDPRGWFQWYCRYFMGRRHPDDARQINRWIKMRRHIIWLQNGCGVRGSLGCRPRQRQALLHWAYDARKL